MKIQYIENESNLATVAARVLYECFIETARTETVLYVQNDAVWSKTPNGEPVLIKQLSGRIPQLSKKFALSGSYKIKKRIISATTE